ncbi:hypothetical protein PU629_09135 [Pullulanibacillus sp. KACC 23026]|uniref:hypothetical protein n=1 Tax=Pullulanibacillus sp. KACC 23026 TaxID=3028315 RepID=UPI0023B097D5|nr:hypothetical protein [Pullulanibacillus sp. KACC 23026]WEG14499.1 hypothetical protein PU629_09135 [Pullulanibacillus sp. KACC 23026]
MSLARISGNKADTYPFEINAPMDMMGEIAFQLQRFDKSRNWVDISDEPTFIKKWPYKDSYTFSSKNSGYNIELRLLQEMLSFILQHLL